MKPYCTTDFCKGYNRGLDFTSYPEEFLKALIDSASRCVDEYTNNIFYNGLFKNEKKEMKLDRYGNMVIRPKYCPITAVESLKVQSIPSDVIDIGIENIDIFEEQGIIKVYGAGIDEFTRTRTSRLSFGEPYYSTVLTYKAGPQKAPESVKIATALIVRNMLRPGDMVMNIDENSQVITQGQLRRVKSKSYEEEYAGNGTNGVTRKLAEEKDLVFTNDVRALLNPYCKIGVI